MIIAVVQNNVVINLIVCESVELAQELLPDALCVDAAQEKGVPLIIGERIDFPTPPDSQRDK